ncbi:MAG TPA: histidine kinase dimerization/phospho-acceptor domain-containing protein, partial [Ancylobacter sp.]
APAEPAPVAAAATLPLRFTWRTGVDARLSHIDPRLAAALERPTEEIAGSNWNALGAPVADRAVKTGLSFNHLPVQLPTARGDALDIELGGAPVRGDGMRGFGIVKNRSAIVTPEPVVVPPVVASPVVETMEPPAPPVIEPPALGEAPAPVRVTLSIVPSSPNVVPLRTGGGDGTPRGDNVRASWEGLSNGERNAFREIARALGARLEGIDDIPEALEPEAPEDDEPAHEPIAQEPEPQPEPAPTPAEPEGLRRALMDAERPILDRLPMAVVAYRGDQLLYANRALLDWTGHTDLTALKAAGGLATLFGSQTSDDGEDGRALSILAANGEAIPVEARLMSAPWDGGIALLYILRRVSGAGDVRLKQAELALREAETASRELRGILDTATDGVVLIDAAGTILSMNHPAEALFGFEAHEVEGEAFTLLFAPESHRAAIDYLDGLASNGVASVLNDGREVIGRVREGGLIPLFMTVGRVGDDAGKFCAVLRDITQWKRAEEELTEAKRIAERANLAKSDFLAKISHEIRTPLNAIIGFSEVMMEERFGAIENQRYRDYLRDIHASGGHLISLINDLLDLSKIEAGKLDLSFTSVPLNEIVQQCMGIMQPQANRERIIIRSSLAANLPPVVADARSIRQIVLNLVSNSIKFTRPGGQVILST